MTRLIDAIIRDVAELPDRNSPDDFPEAMLVTGDELREIIQRNLITVAPTVQREGLVSVPIDIINFGEELESNLSEVFGKDTGRLVAKFSHIAEAEAFVRLYKAAAPTDTE